ncbi:hypothetical protein AB3662_33640 [Sorangium cellulosum]|uniref:hypothetical protein n=1 Tax=Sorangium cellulosum TaxID=56 RepID=UPI003D9A8E88
MKTSLLASLLGVTLLSMSNCSSSNPDPDTSSTGGGGAGSTSAGSTSAGSTSVESTGAGSSSGGGQCMHFASTHEGCQIGGPSPFVCPDEPKGWSGTAMPGEACSNGTDCKGIICKCNEPVQQWYVGVCACGTCADYDVACEEANVVSCGDIAPE